MKWAGVSASSAPAKIAGRSPPTMRFARMQMSAMSTIATNTVGSRTDHSTTGSTVKHAAMR